VPVLAWKANLSLGQALLGSLAFLPGDLLKALATAFVYTAARRAVPSAVAHPV
jgi:biotin transport system substrate-specific component